MPDVPSWWEAALLVGAAFRVWRLLAEDTILDRPRRWLLRLGDWEQDDGGDPPDGYRYTLGDFISCPWCLGFWIVAATWGLWLTFPHATVTVAVPFALSTAVGLTAKLDS